MERRIKQKFPLSSIQNEALNPLKDLTSLYHVDRLARAAINISITTIKVITQILVTSTAQLRQNWASVISACEHYCPSECTAV
jgi:hypothetical protein